jgi:hypothetical protein
MILWKNFAIISLRNELKWNKFVIKLFLTGYTAVYEQIGLYFQTTVYIEPYKLSKIFITNNINVKIFQWNATVRTCGFIYCKVLYNANRLSRLPHHYYDGQQIFTSNKWNISKASKCKISNYIMETPIPKIKQTKKTKWINI